MAKDKTISEVVEINGERCLIQVVDANTSRAMEGDYRVSDSSNLEYSPITTEKGIDIPVGRNVISIAPWGEGNDFPEVLGSFVYKSNIVPALSAFNGNQIWGHGPILTNEFTGEVEQDKEVWKWLKGWGYRKFLLQQIADYVFSENCFSQMILSKGAALGVDPGIKVASLAHIHNKDCRLEIMDKNGAINHVIIGNYEATNSVDKIFYKLPLYDDTKNILDYKCPIVAFHSKRETAGYPYYVYPQYTGVLQYWSPISNKIAEFHLAMLDNSINAKWHIQIAEEYVQKLLEDRQRSCKENEAYTVSFEKVFDEVKETVTELMTKVMSGAGNSGKFLLSPMGKNEINGDVIDYIKITALDLKLKETSESHLKLYEQVISSITSAMSVDTSLASVVSGSKMNSGSEMLNAHNIHQQVKTTIPREVICASINEAIKLNFPEKNIILTFRPIYLVQQEENKKGVKDE